MEILSNRILNMAESETLAMTAKARELKAQGKDVISLSIGEPDFNTPEAVKEAAKKAIDDNFTHYPPVPGYPDLKEAICTKLQRDNGLEYKPEQIVVSTGAKQSLFQVVQCLINPGDEVIIPTPFWVSYKEFVRLAEGKCVFVKTKLENDFKVTPEQLEAAITPRTKLIMFSSPSNPTGMLYTKEELKGIAEVVARHENLFVMADEIYEHINFVGKHESLAQFPEVKDRVITVNGVAKGFAMTGWRIGFIAAPSVIAKAANKLQGQVTSATCSIAQKRPPSAPCSWTPRPRRTSSTCATSSSSAATWSTSCCATFPASRCACHRVPSTSSPTAAPTTARATTAPRSRTAPTWPSTSSTRRAWPR